MKSMTGYAYVERNFEESAVTAEIRGLNSRFLDISISLPDELLSMESEIRKKIEKVVRRGKVDVKIYVKRRKKNFTLSISNEALSSYCAVIKEADSFVKKEFPLLAEHTASETLERASLIPFLLSREGVLIMENKALMQKEEKEEVLRTVDEAVDIFVKDRAREGEELWRDISLNARKLTEAAKFFSDLKAKMEEHFKETVSEKFREIAGEYTDEGRILSEVASLLVRYTINEEEVRLCSHLKEFEKLLDEEDAVGRRLDFLSQEINRELVTIASKSQMKEISEAVLKAKVALENIREQIRNVE